MSWAVWLAVPLVVTVLAATLLWWRARPPRPLSTPGAIRAHQDYLRALGTAPADAGPHTADGDQGPQRLAG